MADKKRMKGISGVRNMFKALQHKIHKVINKEEDYNKKIDILVTTSVPVIKDSVLSAFMLINGNTYLTQVVNNLLNDPVFDEDIRRILTNRYEETFEGSDIESILELSASDTGEKDLILPYFVLKHTHNDTMCMMFREIAFNTLSPEKTTRFH